MATQVAVVVLGVALLAVLAFHAWTEHHHSADRQRIVELHAKERRVLTDALVSRNAGEYAGLRAVEEAPKRTLRQLEDSDFQVGS